MIKGRVVGSCREGIIDAIAFSVGEGSMFERILLSRDGCLPSLSPFLWYSIRAHPDPYGPLWHVDAVVAVEPLPVYKIELANALALMFPHDADLIRETTLRDLAKRPDPLGPSDVPGGHREICKMLADVWRPATFYELLPFFPGGFLRALDPSELEFVGELFRADPSIFAHWGVAVRALSRGVHLDKLRATIGTHRDHPERVYDEMCPALHPSIIKTLMPDRVEGFEQLLAATELFYERGDLLAPLSERASRQLAPHCMTVVLGATTVVMDFEKAHAQAELVLALRGLHELRVVQCGTYDDETVRRLKDLEPDWTVCAARPTLAPVFGELRKGRRLALVHAHKIGPEILLKILKDCDVESLLLAGDLCEAPAHYVAGGGDMFRDLWAASTDREVWSNSRPGQGATLDSIAARSTIHLAVRHTRSDDELQKTVIDWIAGRRGSPKTTATRARSEQTWVILCSTDDRRMQLRDWLSFREVRLGHRVHLLESDEVGTLKLAISIETRKSVPKKGRLADGEDYEIHVDTGSRVIKTKALGTVMEMSDVALTTRWAGPVVDAVLFVADDCSSIQEIGGAVKYARSEFSLAVTRRDQFAGLPETRFHRPSLMPALLENHLLLLEQ